MNKEELKKKFEENVNYLKRNVAPDDIYVFAEKTFMVALFFLYKWSEWVDVEQEMDKDPVVCKWVSNIIGLQISKEKNENVNLDLSMVDEE